MNRRPVWAAAVVMALTVALALGLAPTQAAFGDHTHVQATFSARGAFPPFDVSGTVRSTAPGTPPIGGAIVTLTALDGVDRSATTAPDGTYTITDVPEGASVLRVSAPGFQASTPHDLQVSDDVTGVDVTLAPALFTVSGIVRRAAAGTPAVPNATVTLTASGQPPRTVTTAANGTWSLTGVPPGTYTAVATGTGYTATAPLTITVSGADVTGAVLTFTHVRVEGHVANTAYWFGGTVTFTHQGQPAEVRTGSFPSSNRNFAIDNVRIGTHQVVVTGAIGLVTQTYPNVVIDQPRLRPGNQLVLN